MNYDSRHYHSDIDLRLGRWQGALADVGEVDCVMSDPPYSKRCHDGNGTAERWGIGTGQDRSLFRLHLRLSHGRAHYRRGNLLLPQRRRRRKDVSQCSRRRGAVGADRELDRRGECRGLQ